MAMGVSVRLAFPETSMSMPSLPGVVGAFDAPPRDDSVDSVSSGWEDAEDPDELDCWASAGLTVPRTTRTARVANQIVRVITFMDIP
jgi:hypothetical protein